MKRNQQLLLLLFILFLNTKIKAQYLILTLTDNSTEIFPVSELQSIKFGTDTMIINNLDGTATTWYIDDINNYTFDQTASVNDDFNATSISLNIYPNPAKNLVNIDFSLKTESRVTIDIIDLSGRLIKQVYKGKHQNWQTYQWNSNVKKGMYYCRIKSDRNVMTKPIIIQ